MRKATRWAPDPKRFEAATFYCELHAPARSEPIARNRPWVEIQLGGTLHIGGTTAALQDARLEAIARATALLAQAGIALEVVGAFAQMTLAGSRPFPEGPFGMLRVRRSEAE